MTIKDPKLRVLPSPILKQQQTSPKVMRDVIYALIPATIAGIWLFGIGAFLVLAGAIAGAILGEYWFSDPNVRIYRLKDASAVLTGLLLGLTLPPALPVWMAFLGGLFAIGIGKIIWGGLGQNNFNPALVGRAFLLATFPTAMTTWHAPTGLATVYKSNLALPFLSGKYDAITAATPLNLMKFQHQGTGFWDLFLGSTAGSIGETSMVLLLLGGIYLVLQRALDWRIPVGILASVAVFTGILWLYDTAMYPDPIFALNSGGLMLGAWYMATDPVTSPMSPRGAWIFAVGVGLLIVLIRIFGGFPEGVMYAILLMNAVTPLVDRVTQPRLFGTPKTSMFTWGKK
ncbi:electron transporter RnfD [Achromatium sp. WMS2]|nr:electron transporter RnfD [Achromatium sp. WMS2]